MNLLTIPTDQKSRSGFVWNITLSIPPNTPTTNDAYIIPCTSDYHIGIQDDESGKPVYEFTFGSLESIKNDTALWIEWGGVLEINKAITAMRFTNTDGSDPVTICVTLRGWLNE